MKFSTALLAIASAFFLQPLCAEELADITFAVPDAGLVTLGVFDKAGKLVRTLHSLAPEKDFRVDTNGYATRWDGRDDSGRRLPPGHYHLRGYLIGNVKVLGEDFHFNDWVTDEAAPNLYRILDFSLLENGDVVILAQDRSQKNFIGRYSSDRGFLWSKELASAGSTPTIIPPESNADPKPTAAISPSTFDPLLATNDASAIVLSPRGWDFFSLENGETIQTQAFEGNVLPLALAARSVTIFAASSAGLITWSLPKWVAGNLQPSPPSFNALSADATRLIGAGPDGVWIQKDGSPFAKPPLAANVTSVSLGTGDTYWIVGSEPGSPTRVIAQSSPAGDILRTLRPEPGGPQPDKIRASRTAEKFAALESRPGLQRLRVMERNAEGGWTIAWQRAIEDCARFGFVNDRAVADVGDKIQSKELAFRLNENQLTGKREILPIRTVFDKSGSRLITADGLPLVEISPRTDISRIATCRGNASDSMRLLQGNGSVVEEFSITGLGHILPIDAGGFDLP